MYFRLEGGQIIEYKKVLSLQRISIKEDDTIYKKRILDKLLERKSLSSTVSSQMSVTMVSNYSKKVRIELTKCHFVS